MTNDSALASARSAPTRAALFMLAAVCCFALMGPMIKIASNEGLHVFQIVFFRLFFAFILLAPVALRHGLAPLRSKQPRLQLARTAVSTFAMTGTFAAATMIPLADATAIGFASPLFATVAAVLLLGERIRARRIAALAVGFVGVLVILQPGEGSLSFGALVALTAAAMVGLAAVIIKQLSRTDSPQTIAFWMAALQTPIILGPALYFWTTPSWTALAAVTGLAVAGSAAHLLWARASQLGEVTQLQPIEFIKLPIVALIAYLAFGQSPTEWIWLGGGLIVGSTAYIAAREARLARRGLVEKRANDRSSAF